MRPYLKKRIDELEAIYEESQGSGNTADELLHELEYRTTQRAQALKVRILAANDDKPQPQPVTDASIKAEAHFFEMESEAPPANIYINIESAQKLKPAITNEAQNILRSWTALEVLSPQSFRREVDLVAGEKDRIARLDRETLPWEKGEKARPKKRLYYELILGVIELAPAVESLLKVYSDTRPERPSMRGYCPIATVLLDKEGRPLEEETSFAISSFAWGVPIALKGDLTRLADWPSQERAIKSSLRKHLIKRDENEEVLPLTNGHIQELYERLASSLGLNNQAIKPPYFALRRYEFFASKTPPEAGLLNSFFLEDLTIASQLAEAGRLPHALQHYLGIKSPSLRIDLIQDKSGLQDLLQPALTPAAKWPGDGRHPLALLQQAAVNATHAERLGTGILAVNGPPGTGKTTLLRDVVAARLIERATVMSKYNNPADAFTPSSQTLQRNGAKITLHKLDECLKGYEMVVTSSNNKAVENVSAELPALKSVAKDAHELRYFKTVSDCFLESETWGAIAAVLGNAGNRYAFSQKFWRDEECGLSTYLNHAVGIPQTVTEPQKKGATQKRNRKIVDQEQPPSNASEAHIRWKSAKRAFLEAVDSFTSVQSDLQKLHIKLIRHAEVIKETRELSAAIPNLRSEAQALELQLPAANKNAAKAEQAYSEACSVRLGLFTERPGFWARLFKTQRFKAWDAKYQDVLVSVKQRESSLNDYCCHAEVLQRTIAEKNADIQSLESKLEGLVSEREQIETDIDYAQSVINVPLPDLPFLAGPHEVVQKTNVWFDETTNLLRDNVFESAIKLHRAFIDAAADPLRQNVSIFVESFGTRSLGNAQKDALIADLWASFFLVVPVVSTTFASVHRMFSRLKPEALGWLLVDEAGQAVPQASVGAMIRTKKSVVVGDPLQIEPVVTLPSSLTTEICGYFGVDPLKYNAPEASVQTVADAASSYCARFPIGSGHRDVGAPLLVHRRCDSPMFEISNEIAYAGLMVQAKKPSVGHPVLGQSRWIDVVGKPGPDKWCADEAVTLIEMLQRLRASGSKADFYVVTPFVVVQDNLREAVRKSGIMDGWVENPYSWLREHVGTVHTVQGREAEIVFFVLGAQAASQNGARAWAGGRPNLVNVAVTRAKSSLYVIGNRSLWKSAGRFSVLDKHL